MSRPTGEARVNGRSGRSPRWNEKDIEFKQSTCRHSESRQNSWGSAESQPSFFSIRVRRFVGAPATSRLMKLSTCFGRPTPSSSVGRFSQQPAAEVQMACNQRAGSWRVNSGPDPGASSTQAASSPSSPATRTKSARVVTCIFSMT